MGTVRTGGPQRRRTARGDVVYRWPGADDDDDDAQAAATLERGTQLELLAGAVGLVAAIAGLAGAVPIAAASIATIAVGTALLAQGGTTAARWREADHIPDTERAEALGIGTEVAGGLASIVLGALALIGVMPRELLASAMLVLGASLLLGGPAQPELVRDLVPRRWRITREGVRTSSGAMVMAGLAAIVLGILALVGGPARAVVLALVAVLCIAAALALSAAVLARRIPRRFR
jgi:hypothetical protein